MIITSSLVQFKISDIKKSLDTKITELSNDGFYDYINFPEYVVQSPHTEGPFWIGDSLIIKWNYIEELNNLIPFTKIYLYENENLKDTIFEEVPTQNKNVSWEIPKLNLNSNYYIKLSSFVDDTEISNVSSKFKVDNRQILINSNIPSAPFIANINRTYKLEWESKGAGNQYKIELIETYDSPSIKINKKIGRLIVGNNQNETNEDIIQELDIQGENIIKLLESKYYSNDNTYTWTINDVPKEVNSARIKITDLQYGVSDISGIFNIHVPYIEFSNLVGRQILGDSQGQIVIIGQGEGNSLLSVYGFVPSTFLVEPNGQFKFNYDTVNSVQVYLTKVGDESYSKNLPSLSGTYTIEEITKNEIYVVNSRDSLGLIKSASLDIKVNMHEIISPIVLPNLTLYELLEHCVELCEESLTYGDAIIEPGSIIPIKTAFYRTEFSQMDNNTNAYTIVHLLFDIRDEVFNKLLVGSEVFPKILLSSSELRFKIQSAVTEINRRYIQILDTPKTITGFVFDSENENIPLSNVLIRASTSASIEITSTLTNIQGYYSLTVPGTFEKGLVEPILENWIFNPPVYSYRERLLSNLSNINFIATNVTGSGTSNDTNCKVIYNFSGNNPNHPVPDNYYIKIFKNKEASNVLEIKSPPAGGKIFPVFSVDVSYLIFEFGDVSIVSLTTVKRNGNVVPLLKENDFRYAVAAGGGTVKPKDLFEISIDI